MNHPLKVREMCQWKQNKIKNKRDSPKGQKVPNPRLILCRPSHLNLKLNKLTTKTTTKRKPKINTYKVFCATCEIPQNEGRPRGVGGGYHGGTFLMTNCFNHYPNNYPNLWQAQLYLHPIILLYY